MSDRPYSQDAVRWFSYIIIICGHNHPSQPFQGLSSSQASKTTPYHASETCRLVDARIKSVTSIVYNSRYQPFIVVEMIPQSTRAPKKWTPAENSLLQMKVEECSKA